jgi:Flp pilus assembly pilin Flp
MQPNRLQKNRIRAFSLRGQTLVEYALILAFISVVAIGVLITMGGQTSNTYSIINQQMSNATVAGGGSSSSAPAHGH